MRADLLKLIKRESESFVLIQPVDLTLARRIYPRERIYSSFSARSVMQHSDVLDLICSIGIREILRVYYQLSKVSR